MHMFELFSTIYRMLLTFQLANAASVATALQSVITLTDGWFESEVPAALCGTALILEARAHAW